MPLPTVAERRSAGPPPWVMRESCVSFWTVARIIPSKIIRAYFPFKKLSQKVTPWSKVFCEPCQSRNLIDVIDLEMLVCLMYYDRIVCLIKLFNYLIHITHDLMLIFYSVLYLAKIAYLDADFTKITGSRRPSERFPHSLRMPQQACRCGVRCLFHRA